MCIGCSCTKVDTKVGTSITTTLDFVRTPASTGTTVDKVAGFFIKRYGKVVKELLRSNLKIENILNVAASDGKMGVGLMRTDATR